MAVSVHVLLSLPDGLLASESVRQVTAGSLVRGRARARQLPRDHDARICPLAGRGGLDPWPLPAPCPVSTRATSPRSAAGRQSIQCLAVGVVFAATIAIMR
jgi:hypothetical protein